MKIIKLLLLVCMTCLLASTCQIEDGHRFITIINQSDKNVRCTEEIGKFATTDKSLHCPPTNMLIIPFPSRIPVDSSYLFERPTLDGWEKTLRHSSVRIVVVDDEVYEYYASSSNFDCETIRKHVPVLHCYLLTLEDLQRMNWTVIYPPEE